METVSGEITTTVSVGASSVTTGEGSPSEPDISKEKLPVRELPSHAYSKVGLNYGITRSIGNYEFIRIDVNAEDYCLPDEKQNCWDILDTEVSVRISKILEHVEKFRNTKNVKTMFSEPVTQTADTEVEQLKKQIWKQLTLLSRFGKVKLSAAVEKMKKTELTVDFCKILLEQLEKRDVSFFLGKEISDGEPDAFENDAIENSFEG